MDASVPSVRPRFRLGPVEIDPVTLEQALDAIAKLVERRAGGYVVTPNVDHVVRAEEDPTFRQAYAGANLSLADGQPIVWASRWLGSPLPEKVSGSDLVEPLMKLAADRGWRVYFLGGGPGVAEEAAAKLRRRYPALRIVGTSAAPIKDDMDAPENLSARVEIRRAQPDLLILALGAPKQELFAYRHCAAIRPTVAIGLGGSLDFVAGKKRRAPKWMSRIGLEWLFRFLQEPRRLFHRYFVRDPLFLVILLRALFARRREVTHG